MVLPAAYAPISLGQIQGEFGGDAPIGISEYYRGGAYTTNNNTNVPTGGFIALSHFYSAWNGILVPYNYYREPGTRLTTTLYLSAPGFPTIAITTRGVGTFSGSSYFAVGVEYTITAYIPSQNRPATSIKQGVGYSYDGEGNAYEEYPINEIWVEDLRDYDYADLRWYPSEGQIFNNGGTLTYMV